MVAELERTLEREETISTRVIGRALGYALALHRSGAFDFVDEDAKREMLDKLNSSIARGNASINEALTDFHSHLFSQIGRRKDSDINIINLIVELARIV